LKKALVTGGAGFIGSNFIHLFLKNNPDYAVVNLDLLTYAGNLDNLLSVQDDPRYTFVKGDICDRELLKQLFQTHNFSAVIHFAAESHVDRSITGPETFITTNVLGTQCLLHTAKEYWDGHYNGRRFVHVSTDEVYGSLGPTGYFTEETPVAPNSPYSSSKAGSDLLVRAYYETYQFPSIITRCSNNYGPYQFPEKLIPLMITNALRDIQLPVYGDGLNIRDWLFVEDHCSAINVVLNNGTPGQVYNIGGNNEKTNIEIVKMLLAELGKPESLIKYVQDRLGHDRRYAIDASKIKNELGWEPATKFEDGLKNTIKWYVENKWWWEKLLPKKS
jgi:dTDP-glucose 4,6-dehydratase